ncbi:MAG: tol-pal system protein YbgF [Succinivibrio sp.]|nr:tol-pal system protein YbgF [Succinivibrio sp.]
MKQLTLVLLGLFCQLGLADDLQTQLDAQQHTMLMMQNNLQQLQNDLQTVNGQLEELRFELERLKAQGSSAAAQNTAAPPQLTPKTEAAAAKSKSDMPAAAAPAAAADSQAQTDEGKLAYDAAYALVNQNKLGEAEQAFASFIERYPQHQLIENAWYWQGQVQYKKGDFEASRVSFLNAAKYTSSPKRPDALFKLGKITEQLGDKEKAKRYYEVLIKTYPQDTSALMAQKELSKL